MPGGTLSILGNELFNQALYLPALTYPTLAANASATSSITGLNVLQGDVVSINLQAPPAHIFIGNTYVSAAGALVISWTTDGTGISTGSVPAILEIARPANSSLGLSALPSILT